MSLTKVSYSLISGSTINVVDYGASPSATASQNTSSIQAALTASENGMLMFPPGNDIYLVNAVLTVPSNCSVDFNGNTIKQANGSNIGDAIISIPAGTVNVSLQNGKIDVNAANQSYSSSKFNVGRGIAAFTGAKNIRITNVSIFNPYGSMILLASIDGSVVDGCNIEDLNGIGHYGIDIVDSQNVLVENCTGTGKYTVTGYGIIARGVCQRIRITKNNFKYWQIVCLGNNYISSGGNSSMVFCSIENNTLVQPSADTSIHFGLNCQVTGNFIIDSGDVGISADYSRNTVISNNVINSPDAGGIAIVGCLGCVVDGNTITNPGNDPAVFFGARTGIWGPAFSDPSAPFVYPSDNVISNNVIRDTKSPTTMYNGIDLAGDGTNINFVVGNYVFGATNKLLNLPINTNIGEFEQIKTPTLLNSWVNYGGSFAPVGYYKSEDQTVFLQGLVKNGSVGTDIFVLPSGYRPKYDLIITVSTNTGIGQVYIYASGSVLFNSGGTGYVSLDSINFPTR